MPPSCCAALLSSSAPIGHPARLARGAGEPLHQRGAVLLDLLRLFAKQPRDLVQHIDKARPAVARRRRKIRAAPDRLAVGGEKHGQRPAALLAQMMQRRHVDLIDVRPFFAIDFDVDEQLVHDPRDGVILEAFVRHHVAPVARRVADREQDRLAGALGFAQAPPGPTPTNRLDCACAAGDTGSFPAPAGFRAGLGRLLTASLRSCRSPAC